MLHKFSQYLIQLLQLTQAHYKLGNSFTAKAVPHMLSSVLTDALQMLPSTVNTHAKIKKYQYMSAKSCI